MLPDFGYGEDNYILGTGDQDNKWKMLTGLLGDPKRFSWLMNFIQLTKLESELEKHKDAE